MKDNHFKVTPDLYASKGNRFANYIIDMIIVFILFTSLGLLFFLVYYSLVEDTSTVDRYLEDSDSGFSIIEHIVNSIILALLYFLMELLLKGKSIGKYITKTRVVMEDGTNPKTIDYVKRSLGRVIPFEQFTFLRGDSRGLHDSISNTYVVDEKLFEEKKASFNSIEEIGKPIEA